MTEMDRQSMADFDDDRVPTGIEGLDVLLDGGFVRGGVYLVMGNPGTGKTTLANQLCFAHVARGERAVYVTLLAETHSRMLRHLSGYDFFRADVIGSALLYLGGYLVVRERKLSGLLQLLRQVLRDETPTLLVLDGVATAHSLGESNAALREFVAELQVMADMSACTVVLAANMSSEEANAPEHSMADGLIELTLRRTELRTVREIEVLKFRGRNHFLGRHDLEICARGVVVRPRTEMMLARSARDAMPRDPQRVATGVENLDDMLGGGLLTGSTTMLLGFAGSGKTTLALHFLDAGAQAGEPGLHFGFYEPPGRLIEAARGMGIALDEHIASGAVDIQWQPPLRYGLDALAERLLENVSRRGVRRVVIDGLDGLRQSAVLPERTIRFVTALFNELRSRNVTLLITEETQKLFGPEVEVRIEGMSALVENIILLEYLDLGTELRRLLSIVKQRSSGYDTSIRELCITESGITLAKDARSARAILAGAERQHKRKLQRPQVLRGGVSPRGGPRGRAR